MITDAERLEGYKRSLIEQSKVIHEREGKIAYLKECLKACAEQNYCSQCGRTFNMQTLEPNSWYSLSELLELDVMSLNDLRQLWLDCSGGGKAQYYYIDMWQSGEYNKDAEIELGRLQLYRLWVDECGRLPNPNNC